jgi:DNA (cytosine-5)-methyltransferase 1
MTDYSIPTVKQLTENTENDNHKFNVVSLFAGGGGSSTGYRMSGGKVLAINEFIPEAVATYQANWKSTKIIDGDIKAVTPEQILEAIGKKKGELDLLDGSPPCSAFSTVGTRDKGWGKTKKYSDSEQTDVEDLFFEYIRILRGVMPRVFIAENVAGLAKGVAKGYLNKIIRELGDSGYHVECKILDSKWLGVPQSRTRVIFIGIRNDIYDPKTKGLLHPKPNTKMVSLSEAFKGLVFNELDAKETDISSYAIHRELVKMKSGEQSSKYFQLLKSDPNKVSGCITASSGGSSIAAARHWDNRAFTVSEVKRIMSIPDDYILTGTYQQKIERLGRMVTPFMYRAVCDNLLRLGIL